MILDAGLVQTIRSRAAVSRWLEGRKLDRPGDWYAPHADGQLQFHKATHQIRALFPGNGFGKTRAAAEEADNWIQHTNRWQITPPWPIQVIWYAADLAQFKKLRSQIETETLTRGYRWIDADHLYRWPDGSEMYVVPADRNWKFGQGINPDLVIFDEEPPLTVWTEMQMRRRGRRDTKYVVTATATHGMTWMYSLIYKPWLDAHAGDNERGRLEQIHADTWVWDKGGIDNNPATTAEQRAWYHSRPFASEKEKRVRLYGGFADWVGDSVFREEDLDHLRARAEILAGRYGAGDHGFFTPKDDELIAA